MKTRIRPAIACLSIVALTACVESSDPDEILTTGLPGETSAGDGDGDATGDGDGDATTTTATGDGDVTGDGDGDPSTGDGDGDPTTTGGEESPCDTPNPGWGGSAQVGQPAPHFEGVNQFGDEVSICAYEGLPMVIDTSAVWCQPCQLFSQCLGGDDNACLNVFGGNQQALDFLMYPLREQIANDEFAWVTVLMENANNGAPTLADAQAWDQAYPVEKVWVISDEEQLYFTHVPLQAFPSIWLMDPQMNWQDLDQMSVFNTIINSYL